MPPLAREIIVMGAAFNPPSKEEHPRRVLSARPLLRGYLHAGAAVVAGLGGTYLVVLSSGDRPRQLSMLVYGASLTLLFAFSAVYHLRTWAPVRGAILRRIDHANIFVLIAATYTPLAFNMFSGWWRVTPRWALGPGHQTVIDYLMSIGAPESERWPTGDSELCR